jgi:hypothetical protein
MMHGVSKVSVYHLNRLQDLGVLLEEQVGVQQLMANGFTQILSTATGSILHFFHLMKLL